MQIIETLLPKTTADLRELELIRSVLREAVPTARTPLDAIGELLREARGSNLSTHERPTVRPPKGRR
jgi:hypothetical protein